MQQLPYSRSPLARLAAIVVTTVLFALSFMVGAVVFLALLGVAAVGLLVFYIRLRWRMRHITRARQQQTRSAPGSGHTIDGQFEVVREQERERR